MSVTLRPYQADLVRAIETEWAAGNRNVLPVLPTGGGKSVIITHLVQQHAGSSCVMAHRSELVSQLSLALARCGVQHNIIAAQGDIRGIAAVHAAEFGRTFYSPAAKCTVASVDTLVRRTDRLKAWAAGVTLWVTDEGHHTLVANKWGKAVATFTNPNCKGLLPTATPQRADGKGLGRHADGVADAMVLGPTAKDLIAMGALTPYRVACVESHITEFLGEVAASGDWSSASLKSASQQSGITGSVVDSYRKFADGKLGITFSTDVETATNMAQAYRAGGVPAEVLTGETDGSVRRAILRRFAAREILQLVAVDVISEGFDLPAVECVTLARPTASLAVHLQQIGRGLRPLEGKDYCQIIDHVGNFLRHRGGPDTPRTWTLDRRASRASGPSDAIPGRVCLEVTCGQFYERFYKCCPFCGTPAPEPERRGPPEQVDGELALLDDETLARLRGDEVAVDADLDAYEARFVSQGLPHRFARANRNKMQAKIEAQRELREVMGVWGGHQKARGLSDAEMQRKFYHTFKVDVLTARGMGIEESRRLKEAIVTGNFT